MLNSINPVYRGLCPSCGWEVESIDLVNGNSCSKCLVRESGELSISKLNSVLGEELLDFEEFFEKTTGMKLWGLQKTWIKRILRGENTVLIAPTGMGKTTLLTIYTLYMTRYGKKSIILVPTKTLAKQTYSRLVKYNSIHGCIARVIYYDSSMSKKKKEELVEKILYSEFDILVLTHRAFIKKESIINREKISIVVIDDVDSFLKNTRNIFRLVKLMGFSEEIVDKINEKYKLLWKIILMKNNNREDYLKKYLTKLIEYENEIKKNILNNSSKQVIISSATGRVKSSCSRVINELLSTSISGLTIYGRNIEDTYLLIDELDYSKILDLVEKLGPGGLILISPQHPFREKLHELLNKLVNVLRERKYRVEYASIKTIEKLVNREIDLLIGSSSYYGLSIRGLDAPESIKYVVFIGTPVYTIKLDKLLSTPNYIIRTLLYIYEQTGNSNYKVLANSIRNRVARLSRGELKIVTQLLFGKIEEKDISNNKIIETYRELNVVKKQLISEIEKISINRDVLEIDTITVVKTNRGHYGVVPDIYTYIQGSGRTSRLRVSSLTRGLSIVIEYRKLENIVKSLDKKLSFYVHGKIFKEIDSVDLSRELVLIESTRKNSSVESSKTIFRNILLVVESPTKARTIAGFFGKPLRRKIGSVSIYEIPFMQNSEIIYLSIVATRGHLFDLTTDPDLPNYGVLMENNIVKPVYDTVKKCRLCGHQFTHGDTCPRCSSRSIADSIEIISVLRKIAYEVDEVIIASDPDIEGEKIAYDTYLVVKPVNNNVWRIELHEITLREFLGALENKRRIDTKLVEAEIYRRVVDRLIGFSLSQDLWRIYGKKWLGAGRVQTPVLGWIIDRYYEYKLNKCRRIIYRLLDYPGVVLKVDIPYSSRELYSKLMSVNRVVLKNTKTFVETIYPNPPYTTDQLIHDGVRNGLSTNTVMKIAQDLFESGLITYHRTDSIYVSSTGLAIARDYLEKKNILEYFNPSHWGKPGVHEAIRPVYPLDRFDLEKAISEGLLTTSISLTNIHFKIYDMVFKRFIASEMKPYSVVKTEYVVDLSGLYKYSTVYTTSIVENGFNIVSKPIVYRDLFGKKEVVSRVEIVDKRIYSTKPLYSEGDIVMRMKKEGLGRPSTYVKIINSISNHGYVFKTRTGNLLIPTKTGLEIYSYLTKQYPELVSVDTTKFLEKQVDLIINGLIDCRKALYSLIDLFKKYSLSLVVIDNRGEVVSISS